MSLPVKKEVIYKYVYSQIWLLGQAVKGFLGPMLRLDLEKTGTRDQIANIHWIIEKARVPEKYLLLLY